MSGKNKTINPTDRYHGINGYKRNECRCDICCAAYESYTVKRRKNPELAPMIDAEPLIRFIVDSGEKITGGLGQQFERWRKSGVDLFVADKHCVKRGVHPFEVFGLGWYDIPFVELAS